MSAVREELPLGRLEALSDGILLVVAVALYLGIALYLAVPIRTIHRLARRV